MNLDAVFVDNIDENTTEAWMVKANNVEEAMAIIDRDLKNWGNNIIIEAVFLRETLPTDARTMGYLEAKLLYSWERK